MAKIIGLECANSFVKIYTDGFKFAYPNTTAVVTEKLKDVSQVPLEETDADTIYTIGNERFTTGRLKNAESSGSFDENRYISPGYEKEFLAAVSKAVENDEEVIICTGIPAAHYVYLDYVTKQLNDKFCKTHTIKVNGKSKTFTINKILVVLQPVGTFYYALLNTDGTVDKPMFTRVQNNFTLVVDIGWRTTDIAKLLNFFLEDELPESIPYTAYDYTTKLLYQTIKLYPELAGASIDLLDFDAQLRKNNGTFVSGHVKYDVNPIIKQFRPEYVAKLASAIKAKFPIQSFETVIFTGGGASLFRDELLLNFSVQRGEEAQVRENIYVMQDSQLANAVGYYIYAKHVDKSDRD